MFSVRYQGVPSAPQRGNGGGWRETEALRAAREHTSITTAAAIHHLLASLALGAKKPVLIHCRSGVGMPFSQDPAQGQTQHEHPPASPGYGQRQGELTLCKRKGLPLGKGAAGGYLTAAGLTLTWSASSNLPRCTLTQSTLLTAVPSEGPPHPSEMQSTQQGCAWGWPGRRRFLKAANSTAGSSGTGGELWQATSTVPAGSAGASAGSFCSVSDALSVLWIERFAQSTKELWGQNHSLPHTSGSGQSSRSALDATGFKKNAASLARLR